MKTKEQSMSTLKASGRRAYDHLSTSPFTFEIDNTILTGSVMEQMIKADNIEITDYQAGFDIEGHDYFEVTFE